MSGVALAIPSFRRASDPKVEAAAVAKLAKDPTITKKLSEFTKAVAKAPDLKAALKDPRVLAVLLPAMGLGDQVAYPGLAQRALMGNPTDTKAVMNRLSDQRWKNVVTSLQLDTRGIEALRDPTVLDKLGQGLRELQWRQSLDETTAGMSDALYFTENAQNITNVFGILGNAVIRRVVLGALGLPDAIAIQPVETQARAVSARLPLKDLQDSKKVQKLAEAYLTAANANVSVDTSNGLASLLNPIGSGATLDLNRITNISLIL